MNTKKTILMRLMLWLAIVIASTLQVGCVSKGAYQDLHKKFATYVQADTRKIEATESFLKGEAEKQKNPKTGKPPALIGLQLRGIDSWKGRNQKARNFLREVQRE